MSLLDTLTHTGPVLCGSGICSVQWSIWETCPTCCVRVRVINHRLVRHDGSPGCRRVQFAAGESWSCADSYRWVSYRHLYRPVAPPPELRSGTAWRESDVRRSLLPPEFRAALENTNELARRKVQYQAALLSAANDESAGT